MSESREWLETSVLNHDDIRRQLYYSWSEHTKRHTGKRLYDVFTLTHLFTKGTPTTFAELPDETVDVLSVLLEIVALLQGKREDSHVAAVPVDAAATLRVEAMANADRSGWSGLVLSLTVSNPDVSIPKLAAIVAHRAKAQGRTAKQARTPQVARAGELDALMTTPARKRPSDEVMLDLDNSASRTQKRRRHDSSMSDAMDLEAFSPPNANFPSAQNSEDEADPAISAEQAARNAEYVAKLWDTYVKHAQFINARLKTLGKQEAVEVYGAKTSERPYRKPYGYLGKTVAASPFESLILPYYCGPSHASHECQVDLGPTHLVMSWNAIRGFHAEDLATVSHLFARLLRVADRYSLPTDALALDPCYRDPNNYYDIETLGLDHMATLRAALVPVPTMFPDCSAVFALRPSYCYPEFLMQRVLPLNVRHAVSVTSAMAPYGPHPEVPAWYLEKARNHVSRLRAHTVYPMLPDLPRGVQHTADDLNAAAQLEQNIRDVSTGDVAPGTPQIPISDDVKYSIAQLDRRQAEVISTAVMHLLERGANTVRLWFTHQCPFYAAAKYPGLLTATVRPVQLTVDGHAIEAQVTFSVNDPDSAARFVASIRTQHADAEIIGDDPSHHAPAPINPSETKEEAETYMKDVYMPALDVKGSSGNWARCPNAILEQCNQVAFHVRHTGEMNERLDRWKRDISAATNADSIATLERMHRDCDAEIRAMHEGYREVAHREYFRGQRESRPHLSRVANTVQLMRKNPAMVLPPQPIFDGDLGKSFMVFTNTALVVPFKLAPTSLAPVLIVNFAMDGGTRLMPFGDNKVNTHIALSGSADTSKSYALNVGIATKLEGHVVVSSYISTQALASGECQGFYSTAQHEAQHSRFFDPHDASAAGKSDGSANSDHVSGHKNMLTEHYVQTMVLDINPETKKRRLVIYTTLAMQQHTVCFNFTLVGISAPLLDRYGVVHMMAGVAHDPENAKINYYRPGSVDRAPEHASICNMHRTLHAIYCYVDYMITFRGLPEPVCDTILPAYLNLMQFMEDKCGMLSTTARSQRTMDMTFGMARTFAMRRAVFTLAATTLGHDWLRHNRCSAISPRAMEFVQSHMQIRLSDLVAVMSLMSFKFERPGDYEMMSVLVTREFFNIATSAQTDAFRARGLKFMDKNAPHSTSMLDPLPATDISGIQEDFRYAVIITSEKAFVDKIHNAILTKHDKDVPESTIRHHLATLKRQHTKSPIYIQSDGGLKWKRDSSNCIVLESIPALIMLPLPNEGSNARANLQIGLSRAFAVKRVLAPSCPEDLAELETRASDFMFDDHERTTYMEYLHKTPDQRFQRTAYDWMAMTEPERAAFLQQRANVDLLRTPLYLAMKQQFSSPVLGRTKSLAHDAPPSNEPYAIEMLVFKPPDSFSIKLRINGTVEEKYVQPGLLFSRLTLRRTVKWATANCVINYTRASATQIEVLKCMLGDEKQSSDYLDYLTSPGFYTDQDIDYTDAVGLYYTNHGAFDDFMEQRSAALHQPEDEPWHYRDHLNQIVNASAKEHNRASKLSMPAADIGKLTEEVITIAQEQATRNYTKLRPSSKMIERHGDRYLRRIAPPAPGVIPAAIPQGEPRE